MISRGGRRSTVATLTEIYHYIRLLYVRFGIQFCPECDVEIHARSVESIAQQIIRERMNTRVSVLAPLVVSRKGNHNPWQQWAVKRGASSLLVDGELHSTQNWKPLDRYRLHNIDLPVATVELGPDDLSARENLISAINESLEVKDGHFRIAYPALDQETEGRKLELFSTSRSCTSCGRAFEELDPRLFSYNSSQGWCDACFGTGLTIKNADSQDDEELEHLTDGEVCGTCEGRRLNPEALAVQFHGITIDEMTRWSVREARIRLSKLTLTDREQVAAKDILAELTSRLAFLESVGLSYLSLDRAAPTLSGGEAQRIRLAAQLGSSLCGACYVLDEPTIGLHSRDNQLLLSALASLRDKGNTIVVVEHDEDTIVSADHIIDLGPGGGVRGGEVIATGTVQEIRENSGSVTGRMLKSPLLHPMPRIRAAVNPKNAIEISGAFRHNLQKVNASFPIQALICVTGVSGSGKSTLVREVLYRNLSSILSQRQSDENEPAWDYCSNVTGWNQVRRVLEVDQTPIGKTPRS
ncbi:MAG: excinuclease ABC subunit A, partial [Gammaproteobacteria bacterium]|nr:excinuclease ABC subunit A [Gammaproteobacteria bacterium]